MAFHMQRSFGLFFSLGKAVGNAGFKYARYESISVSLNVSVNVSVASAAVPFVGLRSL